MGVVVYGHWGPPLLGFPTSAGDEWELEGQSMVGALSDFIDAGRVKVFTINSINGLSFYNKGAHPVSPQLRAIRFRFLLARRSGPLHLG